MLFLALVLISLSAGRCSGDSPEPGTDILTFIQCKHSLGDTQGVYALNIPVKLFIVWLSE